MCCSGGIYVNRKKLMTKSKVQNLFCATVALAGGIKVASKVQNLFCATPLVALAGGIKVALALPLAPFN